MRERLGPDGAEALRLKVLEEQAQALSIAEKAHAALRDRETYKDYPPPRIRERR